MSLLVRYTILLLILVLVDGCVPPGGGRELIGEVGTSGPNVFINGAPARSGTSIYSGDSVTTGPGSSAMILLAGGRLFQLDQNTDPIFSWATYESVRCILVRIVQGQGYVDDSHTCISSPAADALAHSAVNIAVSPSSSVLTLLQGRLILERPERTTLTPGQEVTVDGKRRTAQIRLLSPTELQQRVAWTTTFRFPGWCATSDGVHAADMGECRGQFSFARPAPPPPPSPFLFSPFGGMGRTLDQRGSSDRGSSGGQPSTPGGSTSNPNHSK